MCLHDQKSVPELYDGVGYKVMVPRNSRDGHYSTLFARVRIYKGAWHQAVVEWYKGSYDTYVREYGFHAYVNEEDAIEARGIAANWSYPEAEVVKVELSDIFGTGQDGSFERFKAPCIVARAMRIIE